MTKQEIEAVKPIVLAQIEAELQLLKTNDLEATNDEVPGLLDCGKMLVDLGILERGHDTLHVFAEVYGCMVACNTLFSKFFYMGYNARKAVEANEELFKLYSKIEA
jgi:hypothetical protein